MARVTQSKSSPDASWLDGKGLLVLYPISSTTNFFTYGRYDSPVWSGPTFRTPAVSHQQRGTAIMTSTSQTCQSSDQGSIEVDRNFSLDMFYFDHVFPCDDVIPLFTTLRAASRRARFPVLASFLSRCTHMLRSEIARMPQRARNSVPPFQNVLALAIHHSRNQHDPLGHPLELALLCSLQVGMLIGQVTHPTSKVNLNEVSQLIRSLKDTTRPTTSPSNYTSARRGSPASTSAYSPPRRSRQHPPLQSCVELVSRVLG